MAINSMTGFARSEGLALNGSLSWVWELRSVNGKGLDIRLRLPPGHEALELKVKKATADRIARGNLSATLTIASAEEGSGYNINEALLDKLIETAARKCAERVEGVAPARLDGLFAVKGVVEVADRGAASHEEKEARIAALLEGYDAALERLVEAREAEGAHLSDMLSKQIQVIEDLTESAATSAAAQPEALKSRLKTQVEVLLEASPSLPQERLAQEAALLATKADIREEIDRLTAHVAQGRDLAGKGSPCGRKLEFLAQELNREANTLCSKSTDTDLTQIGLDLKAIIDQFREQIQNVE